MRKLLVPVSTLLAASYLWCNVAFGQTAQLVPPLELKPTIAEPVTWKAKTKIWRKNAIVAIKHLNILKAQNVADNWEWIKRKTRESDPYVGPVASATGIIYNVRNMKLAKDIRNNGSN